MAKFRQGDLVLQATQKVVQGSINVIDENGVGLFSSLQLPTGATIIEFSTDVTLNDDSDTVVSTEKAVKTYVDTKIGTIQANKIFQADSYVEVADTTSMESGEVYVVIDGVEVGYFSDTWSQIGPTAAANIGIGSSSCWIRVDGSEPRLKLADTTQMLGDDTDTYIYVAQDTNRISFNTGGGVVAYFDANGLTIDVGSIKLIAGATINEFSTDVTLAGDSNTAVPTEKAVKTYIDTKVPSGGSGDDGYYAYWNDTAKGYYTTHSKIVNNGDAVDFYHSTYKVMSTYSSIGAQQAGIDIYSTTPSNYTTLMHDSDNNTFFIYNKGLDDYIQFAGISSTTGYKVMAQFNPNAAVSLCYNGSIVAQTTANGITGAVWG